MAETTTASADARDETTATEPATSGSTATGTTAAAGAPSAADADERAARKTREGVVVSDRMDKTAVVAVVDRVRHPKYNKFVLRTKKLYAHDEANDAHAGDKVRVMETRPLSKNKRWRITEIVERAK